MNSELPQLKLDEEILKDIQNNTVNRLKPLVKISYQYKSPFIKSQNAKSSIKEFEDMYLEEINQKGKYNPHRT